MTEPKKSRWDLWKRLQLVVLVLVSVCEGSNFMTWKGTYGLLFIPIVVFFDIISKRERPDYKDGWLRWVGANLVLTAFLAQMVVMERVCAGSGDRFHMLLLWIGIVVSLAGLSFIAVPKKESGPDESEKEDNK